MANPWITAATVLDRIANALHVASAASLNARWTAIATRAADAGYRDIYTRLVKRGYTVEQLNSWDYRESFVSDQAAYWALVEGSGLADYSDRDYNKFDHRKELDDAAFAVLINGAVVEPGYSGENPGGSVISGFIAQSGYPEISEGSTFRTQRDRRRNRDLVTDDGDGEYTY